MNISRREIVWGAAGAALSVPAPAQTPPAQTPAATDPAGDLKKAAHEAIQRNSEALAKMDLPIATEPAFQFKA